jgi:glutathione reductase (NADPH)
LMKDYGVSGTENLKIDWGLFKTRRDAYVTRLNGIYEKNIANQNIDYYTGTAKFVGPYEVETSEGAKLTGEHIMIASGSYPAVP